VNLLFGFFRVSKGRNERLQWDVLLSKGKAIKSSLQGVRLHVVMRHDFEGLDFHVWVPRMKSTAETERH
jgi:hypothetical protein